jgi:molybdopterin/thiamine biosynthesis adenylyltransferase
MKILICGAGAIGSNLTARLVADLKGKHEITVLDKDKVEERNVTAGTQFYTPDQVGLSKVEALQFNIYKWYQKEIDIINGDINKIGIPYHTDLIIDCFDNSRSRETLQNLFILKNKSTIVDHFHGDFNILHIGFSQDFTFAIEWAENYKTPADLASGFDICTMQGAGAFVNSVASIGSLVIEEFINNNKKLEITGGKFIHSIIK